MRVLPAGAFTMGSPEGVPSPDGSTDEWPQHRVTLARPIAVGQFPVTRGQFAAFVKATGYRAGGCQHWDGNHFQPRPGLRWDTMPGQDDRHALVCVNWDDVHAYVAWLAAKTGKPYRLLSEAEWEYAAHAGTQGPRYWSGPPAMQCRHTNAADLTGQAAEPGLKDAAPCRDGWARTSPVGAFPPNAFGLYDMLGNALTWTADCYENNYLGAPTDGSSRSTGCTRPGGDWKVLRGSGWSSPPQVISALGRDVEHPISRGDAFGLRVARGE
jgi:formylglycine-generating enzyme required for sulfatase activity